MEGVEQCTKEKDLRQSLTLSCISFCQLCSSFSMQDFILKFLLTVSSSTRKTNSNNLRINRIIHLFLILITDDAIFTLKYYPTRGNLWKPKMPLEQHPLRQSSASNGICAGSSLTGRASGADSTFTELSLGSPAKKTLAKSSPHSCTCVHQGSTRQTDR